MNSLIVTFLGALAAANALYLPLLERGLTTTLLGHDDSLLTTTHFEGGVVPLTVPQVVLARHEPLIAPVVPSVPLLEHGRSDIIAGPSGTIVTNKDYVSPIVPVIPEHREIIVEPSLRTVYPHALFNHDGLYRYGYGNDLYYL